MLRNGLQKKKKKGKCERYFLNEISQDVKSPEGLAPLNHDRRGFINLLFCLSPRVNAGIYRANVEQFIQQLWPTWDDGVHVCLYDAEQRY